EIGIVPQEEDESLPLRKRSDHGPDIEYVRWLPVQHRLRRLVERRERTARLDPADVHERLPQPGIQARDPAKVAARPKRTRERLLHRVASPLAIAEHGDRQREEASVVISVRLLDCRKDILGKRRPPLEATIHRESAHSLGGPATQLPPGSRRSRGSLGNQE